MARTITVFGPAGMATPTLRLIDSGDAIEETITLTEDTNADGRYTGAITAAAGDYVALLRSGSSVLGTFEKVTVAGDPEAVTVRDLVNANVTGGDATESKQDTILAKMLAYFQLAMRKDAAIATDNATELTAINADGGSGAGAFDNATDSEQALRDKIDTIVAGSLSGPFTVTITVDDGTNPVQGALVRLYRTGESETQETDSSGQASFTVTSNDWDVSITAVGFAGYSATILTAVVETDPSLTYSLTAGSYYPAASPGL